MLRPTSPASTSRACRTPSVPEKIAADCRRCPRFGTCGQYAMVTELAPAAASLRLGVLPPGAVSARRPSRASSRIEQSAPPGRGRMGVRSRGRLRSWPSPARWRARCRHRSTKRSASVRRAWPAPSSRWPTIRRPPGGTRRVSPRAPTSAAVVEHRSGQGVSDEGTLGVSLMVPSLGLSYYRVRVGAVPLVVSRRRPPGTDRIREPRRPDRSSSTS